MALTLDELTVADPPDAWSALGFELDGDVCVVGDVRIRLAGSEAGKGLMGWSLREVKSTELDGLATMRSDRPPPSEAPSHPNGISGLDHVVAITPALDRTVSVLQAAGLDLRRIREEPTPAGAPRQAFFRLGATILEVVQEPPEATERGGGARSVRLLLGPRLRRPRPGRDRRRARRLRQRDPARHPARPPHRHPAPLGRPGAAGRADDPGAGSVTATAAG